MNVKYDEYYQTENLFGNPYPELIELYHSFKSKGRLLDLGCGQGRDAIALAKMGYEVVGIDNSEVGIEQLNEIAKKEKLKLKGIVFNIYEFPSFHDFDFILMNSMFHFNKKDKEKEIGLIEKILGESKLRTTITICIQKNKFKVDTLTTTLAQINDIKIVSRITLSYKYEDKESGHSSDTEYEMFTLEKH